MAVKKTPEFVNPVKSLRDHGAGKIVIKGARVHNLKNVDLEIPRDQLVVFTGLSGSGKSSLAFDTIFAEGQRRYVESLSPYARQFLGQMDKPDVDEITGLSPAIAIDQKAHSHNPRSTVGTLTEIYDFLRILFARVGKPYCPECGVHIKKMSPDEMIDTILRESIVNSRESKKGDDYVTVLAPVVRGRKGEYFQLLQDLFREGFSEARIDGEVVSLRDKVELKRYGMHDIEVVVDKVLLRDIGKSKENMTRLTEAVETALHKGGGLLTVIFGDAKKPRVAPKGAMRDNELMLSAHWTCPRDSFSFPEIEPRLFSFNSPYGACEECHGIGRDMVTSTPCPACNGKRLKPEVLSIKIEGKNIDEIVAMAIDKAYEFFGTLENHLTENENKIARNVLKELVDRLEFLMQVGLDYLSLNRESGTLSGGESQRIRLASQIGSKLSGTLYVLDEPTIGLHERDNERLIAILKELRALGNTLIVVEHDERVIKESDFFVEIGPGPGRHGGEIVIAGATSSFLKGGGAERRRTSKIPLASGGLPLKKGESLTLKYLNGELEIEVPEKRRNKDKGVLKIVGATKHNVKNLDVNVPLNRLVCVTGVSGSGKSTLVHLIYKNLQRKLHGFESRIKGVSKIMGTEYVRKVIEINQSPIGRTPRSNPATYTGVFTPIRDLFALTADARERGYKPSRFSFNVPTAKGGGRCEECQGAGFKVIEMHFLPDVLVKCDICNGKRFNRETLEVKHKGKSIADVLEMTVEEAFDLFEDVYTISDKLRVLRDVGLEYIKLGQAATTLSGGEAQRIKLSKELARPMARNDLFILDEPTTGLHYQDVKMLLAVLERLIDKGNTVLLIEHNMHVIKTADYLIDMGPEAGDGGGKLLVAGTPEEVARHPKSHTGRYLKEYLS
ncbi:MAG: ABC-ATPase UvrA [Candidatus Harrisonbacteria bacterium CG10_big_fil_rev_8_21_14_0_10_49_15]|uniref:UvrABC system protein A n=1 Tax=Candidatus Harrisonbacteria bacterium CG10_big_fil_rev_8_21_14_0_10_49_15 TaxID=1974587 RepID=A0A2H0UKT4_9BACT|nr:MAG: ABC-ATPase UvrA [Candidatus Harrisonbacteria bacterium CG10_big_fil_rev_8_21_14_0_10_49_15]